MLQNTVPQIYAYLFLLGSCAIWYLTEEINRWYFLLLLFVPVLIGKKFGGFILAMILGIVFAQYNAIEQNRWNFPKQYVKESHLITGTISNLPVRKIDNSIMVRFHLKSINRQVVNNRQNVYLRLSCFRKCPNLNADESWQLMVRLKPNNGYINPQGFDYEKWLFSEQYRATGYIVNSTFNHLISTNPSIDTLRQQIKDYLLGVLSDGRISGSVIALTIGDKHDLNADSQRKLALNGLSHLMAISGLHIGLSAIPGFLFAGFLWRHNRSLQQINRIHFQWLGSLVPAIFYTVLSGFGLPAQRAMIMLVVFCTVQLARQSISTHSRFIFALWFILMSQPMAPLQISFWLSFLATASLIFLSRFSQPSNRLFALLKLQSQLFMLLMPIQLIIFGQVSLLSPLVNFCAIPFVSLILLPILLLLLMLIIVQLSLSTGVSVNGVTHDQLMERGSWVDGLGDMLLQIVSNAANFLIIIIEKLVQYFWKSIDWMSPYSELLLIKLDAEYPSKLFLSFLLLIIILLLIIVMYSNKTSGIIKRVSLWLNLRRGQYHLIMMLCPPLLYIIWTAEDDRNYDFRMLVFDVGQGLAVLIEYQDKLLLYDSAYGTDASNAVAKMTIIPYLERLKRPIDLLVISHNDADHSGGLESLLGKFQISELVTGPDVTTTEALNIATNPAKGLLRTKVCARGQTWQWSDLSIEVLTPRNNERELVVGNDSSCVILIEYLSKKILLTGDIESKGETLLMSLYPQLTADILLVPHHGSGTSSSPQLLSQLKSSLAIISSGYLNRFNLPSERVLKRYTNQGIKTINTADSGAIEVLIDEWGKVHIKQWRKDKLTVWRRR